MNLALKVENIGRRNYDISENSILRNPYPFLLILIIKFYSLGVFDIYMAVFLKTY